MFPAERISHVFRRSEPGQFSDVWNRKVGSGQKFARLAKPGEPDFLGWEVKQFAIEDFERIESAKPITMMTPKPDDGFYKDADVAAFIRKFGYADKPIAVSLRSLGS